MTLPKLIAFDLDKTLARSKSPLEASMAELLTRLLERAKVAITSGGKFEQFQTQVVERFPLGTHFENFYLLPTSGAALYVFSGGAWTPIYKELLPEDQSKLIVAAVEKGARASGVIDFDAPSYGPRIEYRGEQVTLSALGQQAPVEKKEAWDPGGAKREALRAAIAPLLPDYDVKKGGATSIDVTKKGVNKAYGIRKLSDYTHIPIADMLYIGDQLFPGGNDEVVKETGIATRETSGPDETARILEELL